jgi:hypothetical protein
VRLPYPVLCTVLGLAIGWIPVLLHGPIPEKYDALYMRGDVVVWAWYLARLAIGFLVGITRWPAAWWLRGPLCGLLMVGPLGIVSLGTPACGAPCMFWNLVTATTIGTVVAGAAHAVSAREA